ncbi:hypothetical protein J0S82_008388 [Galemys pyrenaicus]|uniref:Uncharacterized protein n=1 Tax=Galemys pyrenaicus TaxID=202257 RepID=A0A8J5ZE04_GALPY|nr:hypothetical protein J0S82_008388 [Galemys pyrenaicus]
MNLCPSLQLEGPEQLAEMVTVLRRECLKKWGVCKEVGQHDVLLHPTYRPPSQNYHNRLLEQWPGSHFQHESDWFKAQDNFTHIGDQTRGTSELRSQTLRFTDEHKYQKMNAPKQLRQENEQFKNQVETSGKHVQKQLSLK